MDATYTNYIKLTNSVVHILSITTKFVADSIYKLLKGACDIY